MQENSAEELPQLDAVQDNATQEDFHTKNKIYWMILSSCTMTRNIWKR